MQLLKCNVEQPTLFELPPTDVRKQSNKPKTKERKVTNVTIANNMSEALKCNSGLVLIDSGWPSFDPNDRAYFTPDSEKYIEAERLPPDWLTLVGKTVCADRVTVGTISDLMEILPYDVANEWRELYAKSDENGSALLAFEEAHHIRWCSEGYYLDTDEGGGESDD